MTHERSNSMELPEVQIYLAAIRDDPQFVQLLATDLLALQRLAIEPDGWDWADYDGGLVVDHLWLHSSVAGAQARLGRVCHLRARAWQAALAPFAI